MKKFLLSLCIFHFSIGISFSQPGSFDNTFGTGGKVTTDIAPGSDWGRAVVVQFDGKIVMAGHGGIVSNHDFAVVRYNSNGSLDNTFGTVGKVTTAIGTGDDYGRSAAIQSDGKIVVAGFCDIGPTLDIAVVRYNSNGTLDNTFGSGGKVTTAIGSSGDLGFGVALQSDGKIVVAGESWNGSNSDFALVRYNSDGSLDNTFGSGGKVTTAIGSADDVGYSVAIQSDGKIVVSGSSANSSGADFAVIRYNSDGSLDNTFDSDGIVTTSISSFASVSYGSAIQSDGKIVLVGWSYSADREFALVRYNTDGSLDNTFDSDGKVITVVGDANDNGESVAIQSDGKIVMAGGSSSGIKVVRYNSNGSLDNTFGSGGIVTTVIGSGGDLPRAIAIQSDDKIVVAGISNVGGNYDFSLARYIGVCSIADVTTMVSGTTITSNQSGASYQWVDCNNSYAAIAGATNQSYTVTANGNYAVIVALNCPDTSACVSITTVGINETGTSDQFLVFPNPSSGIYTLSLSEGLLSKKNKTAATQICVTDVLGNCLLTKISENETNPTIDLVGHAKGIYFLEIVSGDERVVKKIVLE